jgi:hypothetical protein
MWIVPVNNLIDFSFPGAAYRLIVYITKVGSKENVISYLTKGI